MSDRHPATVGLLRWFEHAHLPDHLAAVSRPIGELAHAMVDELPDGPELSAGLRKLLEAKDCLVRAALEGVQTRSAPAAGTGGLPRCPHRVLAVGNGRTDPGGWLECSMPDTHASRLHRTSTGEAFA